MSFIKRAQEAVQGAAEQAQAAAGAARTKAADPDTQAKIGQQAREAVGMAKRGINTVVERIDPGTLADLIIKATALQEMTNAALRKKGSPYRIGEISIEASIPPGVSFAISRIDDVEEMATGNEVDSAELVEQAGESGESVIALDGTTLDNEQIAAIRAEIASEIGVET